MSAYVVDDSTINSVVTYLQLKAAGDRFYWPAKILADAGYDLSQPKQAERLAVRMFALNVRSVNERSGKGQAKEFRPLNFKFKTVMPGSALQTYASLACWNYQCSEGRVPDTRLYKLMGRVSDALAHEIVHDLPDYQTTKWG